MMGKRKPGFVHIETRHETADEEITLLGDPPWGEIRRYKHAIPMSAFEELVNPKGPTAEEVMAAHIPMERKNGMD